MITNHAQALEGLRNAREQLHDVVLYLKGADTETEWAAHVALDWTRNAIYRGESEALSDVLHAMRSSLREGEHSGVAHTANVRERAIAGEDMNRERLYDLDYLDALQQAHDAQCGPDCECHS